MNSLRLFGVLSAFAALTLPLFGQGAVDGGSTVVKVRGSFTGSSGASITITLDVDGDPHTVPTIPGTTATDERPFVLPVGQVSTFVVEPVNVDSYTVTFAAPRGYTAYINGIERDAISGGAGSSTVPVEVVLVRSSRAYQQPTFAAGGELGDAGPITVGALKSSFAQPGLPRVEFNLGRAFNGEAMPPLTLLLNGYQGNSYAPFEYWSMVGCFDRYTHPDADIIQLANDVYRIEAPQVAVELDPNNPAPISSTAPHNFTLRFYRPGQNANPFLTYQVVFSLQASGVAYNYKAATITKTYGDMAYDATGSSTGAAYESSIVCATSSDSYWHTVNIFGTWTIKDWHRGTTEQRKTETVRSAANPPTGFSSYYDVMTVTDGSGTQAGKHRVDYRKTSTTFTEVGGSYAYEVWAGSKLTDGYLSAVGGHETENLLDPGNRPLGTKLASNQMTAVEYTGSGATLRPLRIHNTWLNNYPIFNSTTGGVTANSNLVTEFIYQNDWNQAPVLPTSMRRKQGSNLLAESTIQYSDETTTVTNPDTSTVNYPVLVTTRYDFVAPGTTGSASTPRSPSDGERLRSVFKKYREDATNRILVNAPYSIERPDGTKTSFMYETGTYTDSNQTFSVNSSGQDVRITALNGVASGGTSISSLASGGGTVQVDSVGMIAWLDSNNRTNSKTTKVVEIVTRGLVRRREVHAFTGGTSAAPTFEIVSWENTDYLANGEVKTRLTSNNAYFSASWANDRSSKTIVDETGLITSLTFDSAERVSTVTRSAVGTQVQQQLVTYTYDAEDRVAKEIRGPVGGEQVVTERQYDGRGLLDKVIEPGGVTTKFDYLNNLRDLQVTYNFGTTSAATRTLTRYSDGRTQRAYGSAIVEENYAYEFQTQAPYSYQVTRRLGPVPAGATVAKRPTTVVYDLLGRVVQEQNDGFGSAGSSKPLITKYEYNSGGRLWRRYAQQGGPSPIAITAKYIIKYDEMGQVAAAGLDSGGSGDLEPASTDRYQQFSNAFYKDSGNTWWRKSVASLYHTDSSNATYDATVQTRLGSLPAGTLAQSITTDYQGNSSSETVYFSTNYRRIISVGADSTWADRFLIYGLVTTERAFDDTTTPQTINPAAQLSTSYFYDAQGRLTKSVDGRTQGNPGINYYSGTNRPWQVRDARNVLIATHTYNDAGRLDSTTSPVGTVNYTYTLRGELEQVSGSGAYPTFRTYTDFGELKELKTYRAGLSGAADTTTWTYDDNTGWLQKKTDAATHFITYDFSFDSGYRDVIQTLARNSSNPPKITNRYSLVTGDLMATNYSGQATTNGTDTTNVSYGYTRTGQIATVTDAAGQRSIYYDKEQLKSEFLPSWFGSRAITPNYETANSTTSNTVTGRYAGYKLGVYTGTPNANLTGLDQDSETSVTYTHNDLGLVGGVNVNYRAQGSRSALSVPSTYRYKGGSVMWDKLTQGNYSNERTFEGNRDVILTITGSHTAGGTIATFGYQTDDAGRREWTTQAGMAFGDFVDTSNDATYYRYTYDARGQVMGAQGYRGLDATSTASPLPGRGFGYTFDDAGNRKTASVSGTPVSYRSGPSTTDAAGGNSLNQVRSRGTLPTRVSGTSNKDAVVTVGSTTATREATPGRYWDAAISAPAGQNVSLNVSASLNGQTQSTTVQAITRPDNEVLNYDDDGNLIEDTQWRYEYDAENRLKRMFKNPAYSWGAPNRELIFTYDYVGRRIRKEVWENGVKIFDRKYIYQRWNPIAEIDTISGKVVRSYAWGLDVASSLTATGGVGALVLETIHTDTTLTSYHVSYDASGNVVALVNRNPGVTGDGTVAVAYEYGPFGENVRTRIDPNASSAIREELRTQPFRFSTKFTDVETGLLYYGHRFYDPSLGRFINRDPAGETGGVNLYGFVGNGPTNRFDVLGLAESRGKSEEPPEPDDDDPPAPPSSRVPNIWIFMPDLTFERGIADAKNVETERAERGKFAPVMILIERDGVWDASVLSSEGRVFNAQGIRMTVFSDDGTQKRPANAQEIAKIVLGMNDTLRSLGRAITDYNEAKIEEMSSGIDKLYTTEGRLAITAELLIMVATDGMLNRATSLPMEAATTVRGSAPRLALPAPKPVVEAPVNVLPPGEVPMVTALPAEEEAAALRTVQHIENGTKPTGAVAKKWGTPFQNRNGDLPGTPGAGGYKEYRVEPPPGTTGAGARRIVVSDSDGSVYYTWTHYGDSGDPAFVRIR